jgi:hypothetical protein
VSVFPGRQWSPCQLDRQINRVGDQSLAQPGEPSEVSKSVPHKQFLAGASNYLSLGVISRIMARLVELPLPGASAKVKPS